MKTEGAPSKNALTNQFPAASSQASGSSGASPLPSPPSSLNADVAASVSLNPGSTQAASASGSVALGVAVENVTWIT